MMDITGWSAVSAYGMGADAFAAGVRARRVVPERLVPSFDQRAVLGKKGTQGMDRVAGLAVTAVGPLVGDPDAALVLGTTAGSVQSTMNLTRASLTGERPFDVEPAAIPSTAMNYAAGQCAIWHGITGPNTTIAGGRVAGLLALAYARRLLRVGRAPAVLCGAVEECSPGRSWLSPAAAVLGEGAAVLRLEPPGAPGALGTVLAVDSQLAPIRQVVARVLQQAGIAPGVIWAACSPPDTLTSMFEPPVLDRVPDVEELVGDTGAAAASFQLAAALAMTAAAERFVVIADADPSGTAAAAVLRLAA